MRYRTVPEQHLLWLSLSTTWCVGALVAWLSTLISPTAASSSAAGLALTALLVSLVSIALRLPVLRVTPGIFEEADRWTLWLGAIALINWFGFLARRAETPLDMIPPVLILLCGELILLRLLPDLASAAWQLFSAQLHATTRLADRVRTFWFSADDSSILPADQREPVGGDRPTAAFGAPHAVTDKQGQTADVGIAADDSYGYSYDYEARLLQALQAREAAESPTTSSASSETSPSTFADESLAANNLDARQTTSALAAANNFEDDFGNEEADAAQLWRTSEAGLDPVGRPFMAGQLRLLWPEGQSVSQETIAFCPAFHSRPDVSLECDHESIACRAINVTATGLRLQCKRHGRLEPIEFSVEWYAIADAEPPSIDDSKASLNKSDESVVAASEPTRHPSGPLP